MGDVNDIIQMHWEIHALHKQCTLRLLDNCGIHFGQPPLLFTLRQHGGGCNQQELARALCVSPAAVAVSLKRMERSGLVKRLPDPNDLRSNRIELTSRGLRAADRAQQVLRQVAQHAYGGFTEEEFQLFFSFYERMRQNLKCYKNQLDGLEESP